METLLRKLSSRKLWMALAGIATGIAMALGADASEVREVAGAVVSVASVITYIVTEGKVDAESVKNAIIQVEGAIETLEGDGDV